MLTGKSTVSDTQRSNAFRKKAGGLLPAHVTLFPITARGLRVRKIICKSISPTGRALKTASGSCSIALAASRSMHSSTMPAFHPSVKSDVRMDSINTEMDVWDHVFQVNFFALIMLARGLSDALVKGPGSIVITSIAGARCMNLPVPPTADQRRHWLD